MSLFGRWYELAHRSVDAASLAVFRIFFGLLMCGWAIDYLMSDRIPRLYVYPQLHFKYYGFDWVQPWPPVLMIFHFVALGILGLMIALGWYYRLCTFLFALGFTYLFLLDWAYYQNHYYLLMLIAWNLTLLPLHRLWSVDAMLKPELRSDELPVWMLCWLRFHIAIPYVYGGIAKLDADWLSGMPMRLFLDMQDQNVWPWIGSWLRGARAGLFFAWAGMVFDLLIVPALLWSPTRGVAYVLCLLFHGMNSQLFSIHIFPWLMIAATTVFFDPGWPRRWLRLTKSRPCVAPRSFSPRYAGHHGMGVVLLAGYVLFHIFWPFRHWIYEGNVHWNERGHYFAWHMMLRVKTSAIRLFVIDQKTAETWLADLRGVLNLEQISRMGREPEMILQAAHWIRDVEQKRGRQVAVHALVFTSLNGRKPQLLIDPEVDLATQPRRPGPRPWVLPLTEPLPPEPWTIPVTLWDRFLEMPQLSFLKPCDGSHDHNTVPEMTRG